MLLSTNQNKIIKQEKKRRQDSVLNSSDYHHLTVYGSVVSEVGRLKLFKTDRRVTNFTFVALIVVVIHRQSTTTFHCCRQQISEEYWPGFCFVYFRSISWPVYSRLHCAYRSPLSSNAIFHTASSHLSRQRGSTEVSVWLGLEVTTVVSIVVISNNDKLTVLLLLLFLNKNSFKIDFVSHILSICWCFK